MATNSTLVVAWQSQISAGGSVSAGSSTTFSVNVTAGFEVWLPVKVVFSRASADIQVSAYSSNDGGANWDTTALSSMAVGRVATGTGQATVRLSPGQYIIRVDAFTSQDNVTVIMPTYAVVTAINNA